MGRRVPNISSVRAGAGLAQGPHKPQEVAGTMEGGSVWFVLGTELGTGLADPWRAGLLFPFYRWKNRARGSCSYEPRSVLLQSLCSSH